jgi:hypothetical protein
MMFALGESGVGSLLLVLVVALCGLPVASLLAGILARRASGWWFVLAAFAVLTGGMFFVFMFLMGDHLPWWLYIVYALPLVFGLFSLIRWIQKAVSDDAA